MAHTSMNKSHLLFAVVKKLLVLVEPVYFVYFRLCYI